MRLSAKVLIAMLIGVTMLGCSKKSGSLVVGFAQEGAESGWRTAETGSIQSEAKARGIQLQFSDAQGDQAKQVQALHSFIAQHVDAIILAPKVETGWDDVLQEAKDAKIPVILVDRGVDVKDDSLYTTLIASDFIAEGHMAADWLSKKMNGKANIAELQGQPGSSAATDRGKGFAEALANYPGMKIVKSETANFDRKDGKEVMEAFLKADPKAFNAVYAHNDEMALGAIQAIQEAGLKPGTDIVIVSIDGERDAFQAMVDGTLNATIECNPLLGPAAFDAVDAVLAGKTLPKKTISKDRLFDQSTAKDAIGSRKY
jgi:simple sugar transport system substrate-binding protein